MKVQCQDDDCDVRIKCEHARPHKYDSTLCPQPFGCGKCSHVESECSDCKENEKRIHELTEQRDHWRNESIKADGTIALMHAGITDLEAKLKVAVEALLWMKNDFDCAESELRFWMANGKQVLAETCIGFSKKARAALKEIEQ